VKLVSGYTTLGIPGIAYNLAKQRGWITGTYGLSIVINSDTLKVGFACSLASNYETFNCDEGNIRLSCYLSKLTHCVVHTIGSSWGDESGAFLVCSSGGVCYVWY
jgi:hypothetical protein